MENKKILYVGWIGRNNIGDEVCWEAFNHLCKQHSTSKRTITAVPYFNGSQKKGISQGEYDMVVLGGGSLLSSNMYLDVMRHAQRKGIKTAIWGTGLDYMTLNSIQNRKSKRKAVFYNGVSVKKMAKVIKHSNRVGIRGSITQDVLKSVTRRPTKLIGDPGLSCLWSPEENIYQKERIKPSDKMVAINWGTSLNRAYGKNEGRVFRILVKVLRSLAQDGHHLVIYPMWDKDIPHVESLYRNLSGSGKVDVVQKIYASSSVVEFLKKMQFTINYKLHANVLSAAAGVPFLSIAYRSKCFDFAYTMGMEKDVVSTSEIELDAMLRQKIKSIMLHRAKKIKIIRMKNKMFVKKQKDYFQKIVSHL